MEEVTYFAVSDIHGFRAELVSALSEAGYDPSNESHVLLVLGDLFDRGQEARGVYEYLLSLPKERTILIRGNHEDLYLKLLSKSVPEEFDYTNGTVDTFCQLAGADPSKLRGLRFLPSLMDAYYCSRSDLYLWDSIKEKVKRDPITSFLKSGRWVNYFELPDYIFVHSFIPARLKKEYADFYDPSCICDVHGSKLEVIPSWRSKASKEAWVQATWGCPFERVRSGLFDKELAKGKTLVCGHWHTHDFFRLLKNMNSPRNDIYFSKEIIGIDGGVYFDAKKEAFIHPQNVLVIKNGVCFDKKGNRLVEVEPCSL